MRLTNRGKVFFSGLAIVVLTVIVIIIAVSGGGSNRDMYVSACDGAEAYIYRGDKSILVTQGVALESGDNVSVKAGEITVKFDDDSYVTMYGQTNISLQIKGEAGKGTITIDVSKGEMLVNVGTSIGDGSFVITTDSATITAEDPAVYVVQVDAMTDYEGTKLHVVSNAVNLKLTATKLNAEVAQNVASGYIMNTSKIATTGKCEIEANNLGDVSMLSGRVAKYLYDMQAKGEINTVYSQSALQDRLANADITLDIPTPTPPTNGNDPTPTPVPGTTATPTPTPGATDKVVIDAGDANCAHDYVMDSKQSSEATCVRDGYSYYKCSKCAAAYLQTVPKAQGVHKYDNGVHTAGDCTTAGYTTFTCTNCQQTKVEQDTAVADHSFDKGVHTDGDCQKFGYTTYTCTKCQETKVVNDTAKGSHKYVDTVIEAANCLEAAYTIHECSTCNDRKVTIGSTGPHSYVDHVCQYCFTTEPGYETENAPQETVGGTPEGNNLEETSSGEETQE